MAGKEESRVAQRLLAARLTRTLSQRDSAAFSHHKRPLAFFTIAHIRSLHRAYVHSVEQAGIEQAGRREEAAERHGSRQSEDEERATGVSTGVPARCSRRLSNDSYNRTR